MARRPDGHVHKLLARIPDSSENCSQFCRDIRLVYYPNFSPAGDIVMTENPFADRDLAVVAPLVVDYVRWCANPDTGKKPAELLAMPLTVTQRELLGARMDDVNVLFAITSPMRTAARKQAAPADRGNAR